MTRLLVSVRSAAEALAAISGGAEIIDVKEPTHGSLGRASEAVWQEVAGAVEGENGSNHAAIPVSVALGELRELALDKATIPSGIRFAKVGLSGLRQHSNWGDRWLRWKAELPCGIEPVLVAYADAAAASAPEPEEILEFASANDVQTILLDTHDKSAGPLLEVVSLVWLRQFCSRAHELKRHLALAGSLRPSDLPLLLPLQPAIIAVRTAACEGGRSGNVSARRVHELRQALAGSLPGSNDREANEKKIIMKVQASG